MVSQNKTKNEFYDIFISTYILHLYFYTILYIIQKVYSIYFYNIFDFVNLRYKLCFFVCVASILAEISVDIKLIEIIIVTTSVKTLPDNGRGEPCRDHFECQ